MVKFENEYAKVLYKKSYTSYSKTCTTVSNQSKVTKTSTNVRMKPSQHKVFYAEGGKIKRDLSIETDLCRIKRKFKQKLMLHSNADTKSAYTARMPISAKSRYSNFTQEDPIEEFKSNDSGCGDNRHTDSYQYYTNKEDLMYDNLNTLFKTWVRQILQDKDLKSLIHTAFENAMQSSESKKEEKSSSCTTYVLEDNNRKSTSSIRYGNRKRINSSDEYSSYILPSSYTVPIVYETLRLISTLSIPKNMNRRKRKNRRYKTKTKTFKMKKRKNKKMLVTLIQPKKDTNEDSDINIDMLAVSTKSWLRRCVNIDDKEFKGKMNPETPYIIFRADPSPPINSTRKDAGEITGIKVLKNNNVIHDTKSLLHGIYGKRVDTSTSTASKKNNYGSDSSNTIKQRRGRGDAIMEKYVNTEYSCHKTSIQTSTILQETDQSDPMVTIDFLTHNLYYPAVIFKEKHNAKACYKTSKKDIAILCKRAKSSLKVANNKKSDDYRHKHFTHLYKRVKKNTRTKGNVINNLQNVINYFVNDTNKNIKLDVHMSVSPTTNQETATKKRKECVTTSTSEGVSDVTVTTNETDKKKHRRTDIRHHKITHKLEHPIAETHNLKGPPTIIPLLDGAASKTEYVFKMDSSIKPQNFGANAIISEYKQDQASMTNDLGFKDEINEIKLALLNITQLVNSYFVWEQNTKHLHKTDTSTPIVDKALEEAIPGTLRTVNPGIKITKNKIKYSGFKLSKEGRNSHSTQMETKPNPKRKKHSIEDNVMNTLASYRIIESESLIEVTNMTTYSCQKGSNSKDVALTCSLPQARSLYEVSGEEQREQLAYYSKIHNKHPVKQDLALQAKPVMTKQDKNHPKLNIDRKPKPTSSFTKSFNSVECNTSCEHMNETKSTKYFPSIESNGSVNRETNYSRETKNVFVCQNGTQRTEAPNNIACHKSSVTEKCFGTKHSVSCQISSTTRTDTLTNNTLGCQHSFGNSQRDFLCQISSEGNKTSFSCQKSVETRSTETSGPRNSFGCQKPIETVSHGTENINLHQQNYDTPKTSFFGQSSFATKTCTTSFVDNSFRKKNAESNSVENANSTELQTTGLSHSNTNNDITTTEATTNSEKDLMRGSPSKEAGVKFHIKKSGLFDQTFTVNLGDDSDSKIKSVRSKTTLRCIKKFIFFALPILIIFVLAYGYMLINKNLPLKQANNDKFRGKHSPYANLNLSELGF